ncbi:unnamed protein product [marine sediment metagenome]|uniref:Uncharacterized protein n=1 Tax=marine sediment metagenome TaxID=412755 RepID=X1U4D4_9ZZZZ
MNEYKTELAFLLHFTSEIYKKPYIYEPKIQEINITKLLYISNINGMGYYVLKKLYSKYQNILDNNIVKYIKTSYKKKDNNYTNNICTLQSLNMILDKFLIFKTFKLHPRIGSDIDVLVPDVYNALQKLLKKGMRIESFSSDLDTAVLYNGLTKIHLHGHISWAKKGSSFFDHDFIWDRPRIVNFDQISCPITNFNADFLIHIAHINFENLHITLSDLLYIYYLISKVNWNEINNQVNNHNWKITFNKTMKILYSLHHSIYKTANSNTIDKTNSIDYDYPIPDLPITLPRKHIILAFQEKKFLLYALSRFLKSTYIIITGDTYTALHKKF